MQTQCDVLGYRIDFCFHDYKTSKEIDKNGHDDRNIHYEIKNTKNNRTRTWLSLLELILK